MLITGFFGLLQQIAKRFQIDVTEIDDSDDDMEVEGVVGGVLNDATDDAFPPPATQLDDVQQILGMTDTQWAATGLMEIGNLPEINLPHVVIDDDITGVAISI